MPRTRWQACEKMGLLARLRIFVEAPGGWEEYIRLWRYVKACVTTSAHLNKSMVYHMVLSQPVNGNTVSLKFGLQAPSPISFERPKKDEKWSCKLSVAPVFDRDLEIITDPVPVRLVPCGPLLNLTNSSDVLLHMLRRSCSVQHNDTLVHDQSV